MEFLFILFILWLLFGGSGDSKKNSGSADKKPSAGASPRPAGGGGASPGGAAGSGPAGGAGEPRPSADRVPLGAGEGRSTSSPGGVRPPLGGEGRQTPGGVRPPLGGGDRPPIKRG